MRGQTAIHAIILLAVIGCGDDTSATGGSGASTQGGGGAVSDGGGPPSGGNGSGGEDVPPPSCPEPEAPVGHFASTTGSATGSGTIDDPWDLPTALESTLVLPGETLYLRGGVYQGGFVAKLDGAAGSPITVRSYPGEWAILDGASSTDPGLQVYHGYTTFRDFEVMNSNADRNASRPSGIYVEGDHIRIVNMLVHDVGTGVICNSLDGPEDLAPALEIYGSLFYNSGWQETDRGHGHHLYLQNHYGEKKIRHNVLFHAYGFGLHAYSETDGNWTQGYSIEQNVWFGNGAALQGAGSKLYDGCLVGHNGTHPAARVVLDGNLGWAPFGDRDVRLGWSAPNEDAELYDNYLVGSTIFQPSWASVTMTGNTFAGSVEGLDTSGYPDNTYLTGPSPETVVFVLPNEEQAGRGLVVIFNGEGSDEVAVDLGSVVPEGASYEVRRAQSYADGPILDGVADGSPIAFPMGSLDVTQPIGMPDALDISELPGAAFDVFVVDSCPLR